MHMEAMFGFGGQVACLGIPSPPTWKINENVTAGSLSDAVLSASLNSGLAAEYYEGLVFCSYIFYVPYVLIHTYNHTMD